MAVLGFTRFASGPAPTAGVVQSQFGGEIFSTEQRGATAARQRAAAGIQVLGLTEFKRAMRLVDAQRDSEGAGIWEEAVKEGARILAQEVRARAPGSMAASVETPGIRGRGINAKGRVVVEHEGARAMEFGRRFYWARYTGRNKTSGVKVLHHPGQIANPFVGVKKGDEALGAAAPEIADMLQDAVTAAWQSILPRSGVAT